MSIELTGCNGSLPAGRIAVVASRYNAAICDALVQGAVSTLIDAGYGEADIPVVRVPGAWELPLITRRLFESASILGVVALGAVIRGETSHDEHINRAVSMALMQISTELLRPVGFGLLTCNSLEQAINRSGGTVGNKGVETANAVLEVLRLGEKLAS